MSDIYTVKSDSIAKRFGRNLLFKNINLCLTTGNSLSIAGHNGSGKSTLLKIFGSIMKPSKGNIIYTRNDENINSDTFIKSVGFVSPDINPYDELTTYENVEFVLSEKKIKDELIELLNYFNLENHRNKYVKHLSSGLKQRLKYLMAIVNDPPVLFLDEPGTNLDRDGKDILYSHINQIMPGKIVIIATNEKEETDLCREVLQIV